MSLTVSAANTNTGSVGAGLKEQGLPRARSSAAE